LKSPLTAFFQLMAVMVPPYPKAGCRSKDVFCVLRCAQGGAAAQVSCRCSVEVRGRTSRSIQESDDIARTSVPNAAGISHLTPSRIAAWVDAELLSTPQKCRVTQPWRIRWQASITRSFASDAVPLNPSHRRAGATASPRRPRDRAPAPPARPGIRHRAWGRRRRCRRRGPSRRPARPAWSHA
jgi:hypothetical protein